MFLLQVNQKLKTNYINIVHYLSKKHLNIDHVLFQWSEQKSSSLEKRRICSRRGTIRGRSFPSVLSSQLLVLTNTLPTQHTRYTQRWKVDLSGKLTSPSRPTPFTYLLPQWLSLLLWLWSVPEPEKGEAQDSGSRKKRKPLFPIIVVIVQVCVYHRSAE